MRAPLWALVESAITSPLMPRPITFDDLVWCMRLVDPDVDVCAIDMAARRFERGSHGALTYGCPCGGEAENPGPHISTCPWNDPDYSEGFPF